jgi:hypothetical protein
VPDFSAPRQQIVDDFIDGLYADGPRCLWLYGPRQSGTSTLAHHVALTVNQHLIEGRLLSLLNYPPGAQVKAFELEGLQRDIWKSESILRVNGNDIGLWEEDRILNERWETLMDCDILFINQLIQPNVEFWKKHLLLCLDNRVKSDRVTLIAGTTPPEAFGPDWTTGFNAQCMVRRFGARGEG